MKRPQRKTKALGKRPNKIGAELGDDAVMAKNTDSPVLLLGVTGSIAAYKVGDIVRRAQDKGMTVRVMMTPAAQKFITPLTLQTLSGFRVATEMFAPSDSDWQMDHIPLAQMADVVLVAPASADTIAKLALGRADDIVSCTVLATRAPLVVAPAMNTQMWCHPATQEHVQRLKDRGATFVGPDSGRLACGDVGQGHFAPVSDVIDKVLEILGQT